MEIIAASLDVTRRTHLFSWLQSSFQALIPHEIMVCGIRTGEGDHIQFDHFSSTRYFTDQHLHEATRPHHGVIWRAMAAWTKTHKPTFLAEGLAKGEFGFYSVPFQEPEGELQRVELKNFIGYGVSGHAGVSSFFCFSRVSAPLDDQCAYLLQLLVPHLHVMLTRMMVAGAKPLHVNSTPVNSITSREAEILQWVHEGQTNQNIADTLNISALTVKNHVQSILRKLDVQNRSHAAVKALNLGLIKPAKPRAKPQKKHESNQQENVDVVISAAQFNPALVENTPQMFIAVNTNVDAFNRPKSKNTRSKKTAQKNSTSEVDAKSENERTANLAAQNSALENAVVITQTLVTNMLSEAELLEKMRIEERIKRKKRIDTRRKMLMAKGLLKKQAKGNLQTT